MYLQCLHLSYTNVFNTFSTFEDDGMQGLTLCFTGLGHAAYSKSTSAGSAQLLPLPKASNC